jgi:hypothetical protein
LFSGASRLTSQFRSFLALDVRKVTEPTLAEAETIRIHELPWNEFVGGLLKQPLMDASQMASLLLLFLYVGSSSNPHISRLKLPDVASSRRDSCSIDLQESTGIPSIARPVRRI